MVRKASHGNFKFGFLQLEIFAKIKQETMYVESCPRDGSDPEAVSGSSTTTEFAAVKADFFLSELLNVVKNTTK